MAHEVTTYLCPVQQPPSMPLRKYTMAELNRLSPADFANLPKSPVILVLDNIRSMHNVGAIFRSADAFAATALYLCGYTPTPPHRDIHKTALGAEETVDWHYFAHTMAAIDQLKANGYTIAALELTQGSTSLPAFLWDPAQPLAIVLGNEVEGVADEVLAQCHLALEIPQAGTKHSLNVSVAAGIALYQVLAHKQGATA